MEEVSIGIHSGHTFTSCATHSTMRGTEAIPFRTDKSRLNDESSYFIRTAVSCQATTTTNGVPLLRPQANASLFDITSTLIEMSQNPVERDSSSSVHPSASRLESSSTNGEPRAFLWNFFRDDMVVPKHPDRQCRAEACVMEAAVFYYWILRHVCERLVTKSMQSALSSNGPLHGVGAAAAAAPLAISHVTLSIPAAAFYSKRWKVDALSVALDAAVRRVLESFHGSLAFGEVSIVPDWIAAVAAASATNEPQPHAEKGATDGTNNSSSCGIVVHVGSSTCSFSCYAQHASHPTTSPNGMAADTYHPRLTLLSCSDDASTTAGDAIDLALLHHILSKYQHDYIDHALGTEGKILLLERIRRAKEECIASRLPVAVELIGGPAVGNPGVTFSMKPELVETTATDSLFRKLTKVLQQASASAQQTSGFPHLCSTGGAQHPRTVESVALSAMNTLKPSCVIAHGRCFHIASLKKRVESLCRTLGAAASASPLSPPNGGGELSLRHQGSFPDIAHWVATGAAVLPRSEQWFRDHRHVSCVPMAASTLHPSERTKKSLAKDVFMRVHGDNWGVLLAKGTALPAMRLKQLDLLDRSHGSSTTGSPLRGAGGRSSTSAFLAAALEVALGDDDACDSETDLISLVRGTVMLPRVHPAEEASGNVFRVMLELRIDRKGEVEVTLSHPVSGTTATFRATPPPSVLSL